jgi:hypothetical protein
MGARDVPRVEITLDFVEASEGSPTGKVTRVRRVNGEEIEETFWMDPQILLQRS